MAAMSLDSRAIAHFNLGSNLGDKESNIMRGADAMRRLLAASSDPQAADSMVLSQFYESSPWGFSSDNIFVNAGLNISTVLDPFELFALSQQAQWSVSTASHRTDDDAYADRVLDIDFIFYGDTIIESPRLTLPHPRAELRPFVIEPLLELNPGFDLALLGEDGQ